MVSTNIVIITMRVTRRAIINKGEKNMEQTDDLKKNLYQKIDQNTIRSSYTYDTFRKWSTIKNKDLEEIKKINEKTAESTTLGGLPTGEIPLGEPQPGANFVESGIAMSIPKEASLDNPKVIIRNNGNDTITTRTEYSDGSVEIKETALSNPQVRWMSFDSPVSPQDGVNLSEDQSEIETKVTTAKELLKKGRGRKSETDKGIVDSDRSIKNKLTNYTFGKYTEPEPLAFGSDSSSIYGGISVGRSPLTVGMPGEEHLLILTSPEGREMLRMDSNGDIYVRGNLAAIDSQIVDAMRNFLRMNKMHP